MIKEAIAAALLKILTKDQDGEEALTQILSEECPQEHENTYLSYDNGIIDIIDEETDEVIESYEVIEVTVRKKR